MLRIPGEEPPRASLEWTGVEMKLPAAGHTPELPGPFSAAFLLAFN